MEPTSAFLNFVLDQARQRGLVRSLTELHTKLRDGGLEIGNSTLNKIRNDYQISGATLIAVEKALQRFCELHGIDVQAGQVGQSHPAAVSIKPVPAPEILSGAWLLIQFRGQRVRREEPTANDDFRTAVLFYGAGGRRRIRGFQIIGSTSLWAGQLREYDGKLLYEAKEISRMAVEENIWMILFRPYERSEIPFHHGIIMGIGRGEMDAPHFPIYSSRVMLRQIPSSLITSNLTDRSQLQQAQIDEVRSNFCGYFPRRRSSRNKGEGARSFLFDSFDAFDSALATQDGNFGNRIFVRS